MEHHQFGKPQSPKNKLATSIANMGKIPWNKGKRGVQEGKIGKDHPMFGKAPWNKGMIGGKRELIK